MRYWHPMTEAVVRSVERFKPDRIVLLPLYPQFSTATTESSFKAWNDTATFKVPTTIVTDYPTEPGFIAASVALLEGRPGASRQRAASRAVLRPRPARARDQGGRSLSEPGRADGQGDRRCASASLDWSVCYQSRVGPLKWIGPSTDAEIARAGADKVAVVLYPLSFVSEHSETLVELDIEYRHLAEKVGVPAYIRVPTVGTHPLFIAGLARLVRDAL